MKWRIGNIDSFDDYQYETAYKNLSNSEKEHIDSLLRRKDKKRSLLARILLKNLLAEENIPYVSIELAENKKPFLSGSNYFISLSHSGNFAVCAVSERAVGIDIEQIKPVKTALVKRVCTKEEEDYIFEKVHPKEDIITDPDTLERFFRVWTAKEAYFKKKNEKTFAPKEINTLPLKKHCEKTDNFIITII